MDELYLYLIIALPVISVLAAIARVLLVAQAVRKGKPLGFTAGLDPQVALALRQLESVIAQAQNAKKNPAVRLPPEQLTALQAQFDAQARILQQSAALQAHARWTNDMQRQSYDTFVGGIMNNAAAAGFDVSGLKS